MLSKRIAKVNQLLKKELSLIILKEVEFPSGLLATITRAETSPDLADAKIYISIMPEDKTQTVLQILGERVYEIQQRLNKRLKMKIIPKIIFREEKSATEAGRIEKLLEEIKKKRKY